jgi:prepilin-type processing-associated H-X9-DG protein/prepilin-type N-terminal cleavage/methylation domain-containing protein
LSHRRHSAGPAFTLIEMLITISIVGVLFSLVVPLASRTVKTARSFKCQSGLRNIAYDFNVFADENLHGPRGSSSHADRFDLDAFQDSQYCVNDFWCWDGEDRHEVPDTPGNDPMRCPEVRGPLVLRANAPCNSGGVSPPGNVSYGFNARLRWRERQGGVARVELTSQILERANCNVPLVWDIDGALAAARGGQVFYSAPALDSPLVFAGDAFWYPAMRHGGQLNTAFIDGHVASSGGPLHEPTWRWEFVPAH